MINNDIIINDSISLLEALSIMDSVNRKLLIVCDQERFLGVISIGDVQRAILEKKDISLPVSEFVRKKITYASVGDDNALIKNKMRKDRIEAMPVVDANGILCDVIEWNELFVEELPKEKESINLPVVIMAGGKGTRLLPLTNVIPKPLIPISDKTIIEEIMVRFRNVGCKKFYISVNYMMDVIKDYFNDKQWDIDYIQESKPLGTGGSLYLLKNKINTTFFVTNCDTLIDIDYSDLIDYHYKNNNIVTVVSAVKTMHIPYGTIETGIKGVINELHEKPDYVYQINSGFYVIEAEVLDYIKDEQFLNLPDLISDLIKHGKKVGAFPISQAAWTDMGNWDEYHRLVNKYMDNFERN